MGHQLPLDDGARLFWGVDPRNWFTARKSLSLFRFLFAFRRKHLSPPCCFFLFYVCTALTIIIGHPTAHTIDDESMILLFFFFVRSSLRWLSEETRFSLAHPTTRTSAFPQIHIFPSSIRLQSQIETRDKTATFFLPSVKRSSSSSFAVFRRRIWGSRFDKKKKSFDGAPNQHYSTTVVLGFLFPAPTADPEDSNKIIFFFHCVRTLWQNAPVHFLLLSSKTE